MDISSETGEKNLGSLGKSGYCKTGRDTGDQNHGASILGPERSRAACLAGPEARCPLTRKGKRAPYFSGRFPGFREAISLCSRQVAFLGNRTRGASILHGDRRSLPNFVQPYCIVLGVVEGKRACHTLSSVLKKWAPPRVPMYLTRVLPAEWCFGVRRYRWAPTSVLV